MTTVLFDSNILVYAHNFRSPFYKRAIKLQEKVVFSKLTAAVAIQNLLEFYSAVTNRKTLSKPLDYISAQKACLTYFTSGFIVIYPKENDFKTALTLAHSKKITGRRVFDVYLVATMLSNGIKTIYTANDRDFKMFKEIKVVNPFK